MAKKELAKKEFLRIVVIDEKDPHYAIEYIDESGDLCRGYVSDKLENVVKKKRDFFDYRPKKGDEVETELGNKGVVTYIHNDLVQVMFPDGSGTTTSIYKVWATGHHFACFDKLLKEMQKKEHEKKKVIK